MDEVKVCASVSEEKSRIDAVRGQFVAEIIPLLEEALSKNLLSFTTLRTMNYEEVQIRMTYGESYIVFGRMNKIYEYSPYAEDHVFRICRSNGEDLYWFKPLVLDDSVAQNEFLSSLRNKLAGFHNRLMKTKAPSDVENVSKQLYEQSRFMRHLRDSLSQAQ